MAWCVITITRCSEWVRMRIELIQLACTKERSLPSWWKDWKDQWLIAVSESMMAGQSTKGRLRTHIGYKDEREKRTTWLWQLDPHWVAREAVENCHGPIRSSLWGKWFKWPVQVITLLIRFARLPLHTDTASKLAIDWPVRMLMKSRWMRLWPAGRRRPWKRFKLLEWTELR